MILRSRKTNIRNGVTHTGALSGKVSRREGWSAASLAWVGLGKKQMPAGNFRIS